MKRIVRLFLSFLCICAAYGQGTLQFVAPGGFANVEGNSSSADLFRTSSTTFQQVYSASEFAFGFTNRIDGISFRFDEASGQSFVGLWPSISVLLSTTARSPDSLSPNYSDNGGPIVVEVFAGPLGIVAPSSGGLRPFQVNIPFSTPFFYDPSQGNLSVVIGASPGPISLALDAHLATGDSVGRVFGGISTMGTVDTLGLITRFDVTPIPEPTTCVLGVVGAVILWGFHRRKRLMTDR